VRTGSRRAQHRFEHTDRAPHGVIVTADAERFAFDADDDGDQRFEGADVAVVMTVEAEMVVQAIQGERRFGGEVGQRSLLVGEFCSYNAFGGPRVPPGRDATGGPNTSAAMMALAAQRGPALRSGLPEAGGGVAAGAGGGGTSARTGKRATGSVRRCAPLFGVDAGGTTGVLTAIARFARRRRARATAAATTM
jgi:hypothetical protein